MQKNREIDIWDEIEELVDSGYTACDNGECEQMITLWMQGWEKLKDIANQIDVKMKLWEMEELASYDYIGEWIQDFENELMVHEKYESCLQFCKEVLDQFILDDDDDVGGYKISIGESLYRLNRKEEGKQWFEEWLKEEPCSVDGVNGYAICLIYEGKSSEALQLLEAAIADRNCTLENDVLFSRAIGCCKALKEQDKEKFYTEKYNVFNRELQMMMEDSPNAVWESIFDESSLPYNIPVIKEKKTYPNDPCPCGSDKKYKKCCGKNK